MFFFNKKKKSPEHPDLSAIGTDMHSHLIPGIDDGSPDIATSLELIRGLQSLGYRKLITTPHILGDMYPNTRGIILAGLADLKQAVTEAGIDMEIEAAAEYFLDEHMEALLRDREPLLTFGERYVLTEFSMAFLSQGVKELIFELQMQGYQPVIAHPERYIYLAGNQDYFEELKATGCLFQLNLLSLTGYYGKSVQDLAQILIKKNYYDLLGTDLHSQRYLQALRDPALPGQVQKLIDTGQIRNGKL